MNEKLLLALFMVATAIMISIVIENWIAVACYWILSAMTIFYIFTETEEKSSKDSQ
ncbi:hypothetical protein AB5N96_04390 [Chryseomicrobium imtechense]